MRECEYCGELIWFNGKFWVTGPAQSMIPERNMCQSPKCPNYRHSPKRERVQKGGRP